MVGEGGAPPVAIRSGRSRRDFGAAGSLISMMRTVGAPLKCVTPCSEMSFQTSGGSIFLSSRCRPPAPVNAHGKHQPLQWNIGSVHRKTDDVSRRCAAI